MLFNEYINSIGDPSFISWTITIAYFLTAFLCLRVLQVEKKKFLEAKDTKIYYLWLTLFVLLFLLGLNKQLDFQTLLRIIVRHIVEIDFSYRIWRWFFQKLFSELAGLFGLCCIIGLLWWLRGRFKEFKLVIFGLLLLIIFLVIRIASINHVGHFLNKWKMQYPSWMNYVIELGGLVLIGVEAIIHLNSGKRKNLDSTRHVDDRRIEN